MAIVKIKDKYQVTLPAKLRQEAGLEIGDLLEADVHGGKITLTPKHLVDRELAIALQDVRRGRVTGPYSSAKAALRALKRRRR
jgi:AbrB family looped-hinge helix DNA binding protein